MSAGFRPKDVSSSGAYDFSSSGGDGMIVTAGNASPIFQNAAFYQIQDDGKIIVDNVPDARDLLNASPGANAFMKANELDGISGVGGVEQRGTLPLTLGSPTGNANTYTGSGGVVNGGTLQAAAGVHAIVARRLHPGDGRDDGRGRAAPPLYGERYEAGLPRRGRAAASAPWPGRRDMIGPRHLALMAACLLGACGGGGSQSAGGPVAPPAGLNTVLLAGAPTLLLNVGGSGMGVDYDTLKVAGRAALSGNLQLHFINGYKPASGQSFVVVTAQGGVTGTFGAVNTDGVAVSVRYDPTQVTVTVS